MQQIFSQIVCVKWQKFLVSLPKFNISLPKRNQIWMSSNASNNREIERESRQRVIREAKRHVYVKRQTRICTTWPSFSFTCRLLFNTQISSCTLLLSIRIVLNCVYLLIFYFEKFSTWIWQLPYAVNVTLNRVIKNHVHAKRQTWICTAWPRFPLNCRLLFIVSTQKYVVSSQFYP